MSTTYHDEQAATLRAKLPPGTVMKASEYALRPLRDYWLAQGQYHRKNAAKAAYDAKAEERWTVTSIGQNSQGVPFINATCGEKTLQSCAYRLVPA